MLLLSLVRYYNNRIFILFIILNSINHVKSIDNFFGVKIPETSSGSILSRLLNSFTRKPFFISNESQQQKVKVPLVQSSDNKSLIEQQQQQQQHDDDVTNNLSAHLSLPLITTKLPLSGNLNRLQQAKDDADTVKRLSGHVEAKNNKTTIDGVAGQLNDGKNNHPSSLTNKINNATLELQSINKLINTTTTSSSAINDDLPPITSSRPSSTSSAKPIVIGNTTTKTPSRFLETTQKTHISNLVTKVKTFDHKQLLIRNNINIERALDIEGVKCGTVPIFEKIYKRSYNGSAENIGEFKILRGIDSIQGEWPWIVQIQECMQKDTCITCTGTLLNHRWLITAGHCGFNRSSVDKFKATFGLYDLIIPERESFSVRIDKIIVHPEYNDLTHDITLMRLAEEIKFNDLIQPACLIHGTRNILDYTKDKATYTVGYGLIEGMVSALKLQKLQIKTKQPSECNSDEMGGVVLRRGTMCIGTPDGKEGSSCRGDSGGPDLVYDSQDNKWVIFGTVSYGPADCDREDGEKWLTVSVDLSNYRTWILKTILVNS